MGTPAGGGGLPVSALPLYPGESYFVQRGKFRPAVIVAAGGGEVPRTLRPSGTVAHQTAPTLLVAPSYGAEPSDRRAGWHPELVDRIRHAEYPQYIWDRLPVPGAEESVIRLDHIFPVSTDPASFEIIAYRLSGEALGLLDEWLQWLLTGALPEQSVLGEIRASLLAP